MDNRWRFLYCASKKCGDACASREPGKRKPVQAEYEYGRQIRHIIRDCDVDRKIVGKYMSHVPRKAAIAIHIPVP